MEVVFGWFLDGLTYPENVSGRNAAFNSLVCGPAGLLNLLEVSFGTGGPNVSLALRIAEYVSAIESHDDGKQFFSASFAVDPWSTARKLLQMRDQLVATGWSRQAVPGAERTAVFAAIEEYLLPLPGSSDRLVRTITELNKRKSNPIKRLTLATPMSLLPKVWQSLLAGLVETGTLIDYLTIADDSPDSDLLAVRQALATGVTTPLTGDGTFIILDAENQIQASEVVASWLRAMTEQERVLIIRGQDTTALDQACIRNGIPKIGSAAASPHRAILQVLPLAFELTWTPFNSYRCLEFLSLSGGPIPGFIARLLKDALKRQPGMNGPHWKNAWLKATDVHRTRLLDKYGTSLSEGDLQSRLAADIAALKAWFEPVTTDSNHLSSAEVEAVCRRVETWAMKRTALQSEHSLYAVAAGHAAALASIVNGFGNRALNVHQLRSIINTVVAEGAIDTEHSAEAASWSSIDRPGQLWGAADTVIWWDFASSASLPAVHDLWSPSDIQALAQNGHHIDQMTQHSLREAQAWRLPVFNCRKKLILVKPRTVSGKIATVHPFWDEITAIATDDELQKTAIDGSALLSLGEISIAGTTVKAFELMQTKLPGPLPKWTLPPGLVTARKEESFTSMERLLACPLSWTFEYPGNVRPGALQALPGIDRLTGDFAHAVIANLFAEKTQWAIDDAKTRVLEVIDELLPKLAAPLLLPENAVQLRKTKQSLVDAIAHLITILEDKQLQVECCEVNLKAPLGDHSFGGSVDLLLKNAEGRKVVLDLKWSKFPNTFRRKIVEGNALQLASYSWLINCTEEDGHGYAPAGFYLLRQGRLFSDSSVLAQDPISVGRSLQETWSHAQELHRKHFKATCDGQVVATGFGPTDSAAYLQKPFIEPPCGICNYAHFCGVKELE